MIPRRFHTIPKRKNEPEAADKSAEPAGNGAMNLQDPSDKPGGEMAKDSQVWRTYVKETDTWDKEMVQGHNNSLDVLLIFAALFSAVSTAFVVESLGDLKPDPTEFPSQTLLLISQTLIAISNGQPVVPVASNVMDPPSFVPSHTAVVVNLLWFLSLSLSIGVSLIAMLAKEWCHIFMSRRSGPMYEQARRRQKRWNGIERWRMKEVLTYLPGMMHLALLLFAIGLSIYLWDINPRVAIPVMAVTASATLVYICVTILPFLDDHCPYASPFTALLLNVTRIRSVAYSFSNWLRRNRGESSRIRILLNHISNVLETRGQGSKESTTDRDVPMDTVTSQMLGWMIFNCEDSRSLDFALQGLAGSAPELPYKPLIKAGLVRVASTRIQAHMEQWVRMPETSRSRNSSMLALTAKYSRLYTLLVTQGVCSDPRDRWEEYLPNEQRRPLTYKGIDMIEVNVFVLKHVEGVSRDLDEVAVAVSATTPFCHFDRKVSPQHEPLLDQIRVLAPRLLTATLTKHMDSTAASLSFDVLQALVQSSIHYLVGLHPREELANRRLLLPLLLARLFVKADDVTSSRLRQVIAVTLAAAAFAVDKYPGGDQPLDDNDSRERRAMQVFHHYRSNPPNAHDTRTLLRFGFIGLLQRIDFVSLEQHANLIQEILGNTLIPKCASQLDASILPTSFNFREHMIEATLKCLALVPQAHLALEAESRMASHCLGHLVLVVCDSHKSISAEPRLYVPVLVAFCHAQSDELPDLCMAILREQDIPSFGKVFVEDIKEHQLFDLLYSASVSKDQRVAPTAALHFTLLLAVIILFPKHPFRILRTVFESLIQRHEFSSFTPSHQDRRRPNLTDLQAAIENTTDPSFASGISRSTKQLVVDFYFANSSQTPAWAKELGDWSIFKLPGMLKKLKARFETAAGCIGPPPVENTAIMESSGWPRQDTVNEDYPQVGPLARNK